MFVPPGQNEMPRIWSKGHGLGVIPPIRIPHSEIRIQKNKIARPLAAERPPHSMSSVRRLAAVRVAGD